MKAKDIEVDVWRGSLHMDEHRVIRYTLLSTAKVGELLCGVTECADIKELKVCKVTNKEGCMKCQVFQGC